MKIDPNVSGSLMSKKRDTKEKGNSLRALQGCYEPRNDFFPRGLFRALRVVY